MKRITKTKFAAMAGIAAAIALPAAANHSWADYKWELAAGEQLTMPVIDNTGASWVGYVETAVGDWNASPYIEAPYQRGSADPSCPYVRSTIQVCNDDYGATGWLGIASITISGSTITAGVTKLNDNYFTRPNYNNFSWRQLVTCQEIGHDYGLGHQNENFSTDLTTSCMEYTSLPEGNEHPDQHDYDQLAIMYGGSTGGDGGGGTKPGNGKGGNGGGRGKKLGVVGDTPANWGRAVEFDAKGVPFVFIRDEGDGDFVVTHVTWAPGEGPRGNRPHDDDHDH